ncbi:MAG TPA: hypothetical protein VK860_06660 [Ilumatobacteraceae bacterium]|nr:hypothetical protein [Ilumatobacteraceae bacterium]
MAPRERRLDPIREAACLAHTIPGVSLRLPLANDESLLVSRACIGADLDPCQLRSALIVDRLHGLRALTELIVGVEIVSGLVDRVGGIHERIAPDGTAERWFTSELGPSALTATLSECPADPCFDIVVKPDLELGLSAVCLRGHGDVSTETMDETAFRAFSSCLVAELLTDLDNARA